MKEQRKSRFKQYTFGLILAFELIMSFTFLGYIHIDPISLTTAHIPIVVAGCLLGPLESTIIGFVFGLGSMYKASAMYVVSVDRIFSPVHSNFAIGSIFLSVGTRTLFGFIIGILFLLVKSKKHKYLWNGIIAVFAPTLHSLMVFGAMGVFFPECGFSYKNAVQINSNDIIITIICVICVEVIYACYNSACINKYKIAIDQARSNPFFSKKIGVRLAGIGTVIVCMAIISTVYFSDRAKKMLLMHGVEVSKEISSDLLNVQIQFLIAMLALDLILILLLLMGYRYMAYKEYKGEMDHLTGVMGRKLFLYYCNKSQEETHENSDGKGWFLFLDVDCFKQINDTFGHTVGDETLRQMAKILKDTFKEYGAVGRVGGDEFAVIIDHRMSRQELEEKLRGFLQDISNILPEKKVSCSIGAYRFVFPQETKYLLEATDAVLYKAKANGKGCFIIQES